MIEDVTCYDENTLFKVATALKSVVVNEHVVNDCVNQMQNAGILFRERCK